MMFASPARAIAPHHSEKRVLLCPQKRSARIHEKRDRKRILRSRF
ncbi:MAG: hypothetical protein AAGA60_10050 [Cyanobacteria bacterium P01_E01_bin.42]